MHYVILNNDLAAWAVAICIGAGVCALLYVAKGALVRRLGAFAQATATYLDDLAINALGATHPVFILAIGTPGYTRARNSW